MPPKPPDLNLLCSVLADSEIRYVLIGGLAVVLHGGSQVTMDVDLAIAFDQLNRRHVVDVLAKLNPRPIRPHSVSEWVWDEKSIRAPWSIFDTDAGRIDLIVRLPGIDSFDKLFERSQEIEVGAQSLRVASVIDLIAMKSASDRLKDRVHLAELEEIRSASR